VAIGGRGVLIAGASGAGKSDLAMRLIDRGAALVADDYVSLRVEGGQVIASAPEAIAGMIELRGVGLLTLPYLAQAPVALVVDLDLTPERLPDPDTRDCCGIPIPAIGLNALEPSAAIKVEAALSMHGVSPPCPA
jgi:serine kinase of HPr protein (carbohydrate metabolism regulator)